LISFKFKKVISVVENDDNHFVLDLLELDFAIIVKFCDFVKLVPEYIPIPDPIKIDVKVHFEDPSLNEISHTFKDKRCPAHSHWTIDYVNHLEKILDFFHELEYLSLTAHDAGFDFLVGLEQFRGSEIVDLFVLLLSAHC
jgi:hypothetical protein